MKNRITALVLCAIMFLSALVVVVPFNEVAFAEEVDASKVTKTKVTLHYFRYAEDYTGWSVWMWKDGAEGTAYTFRPDGEKMVKTSVTYNEDATVKFLIRLGNWDEKDIDSDRTIDNEKYTLSPDGKTKSIDIYVAQSDATIYYDVDKFSTDPRPSKVQAQQESVMHAGKSEKITVVMVELFGVFSDVNDFSLWKYDSDGVLNEVTLRKVEAIGNTAVKMYLPWEDEYDITATYAVKWREFSTQTVVSLDSKFFTDDEFTSLYSYEGQLGAIHDSTETVFKLWAPLAQRVILNVYNDGNGGTATKYNMVLGETGVWAYTAEGDLNKKYYTYTVYDAKHADPNESVDPYAVSVGVNGDRGMILNLSDTDPDGWDDHSIPTTTNRDAVIYEAHIRDLTIDPSSGVTEANRGKYLGITETGTTNSKGQSTALDHLVELGVTHLHILPSYDYASVDETNLDTPQFNWGYDPKNYNAPEGSYSSDPYHGEVRVNEYKQMVQALHENGIKVVMDVVYNHTYSSGDSWFSQIFYGYYYRMTSSGAFSNGSGCGNETASEHYMMRKFMIDSVVHWATEYKLDGFRFDLMGVHDIVTMNMLAEALREVNPDILIYGEGWAGGTTGLSNSNSALKANGKKLDGIAVFNDDMRDGIKGSVFDFGAKGYVSGASGLETNVLVGTIGAITGGRDIKVYGGGYTNSPMQCINYVSAHDNNTLWDKLLLSNANDSDETRTKMNMMSATLVFTGQGIPFFLNGEEMRRQKVNEDGTLNHNSYNSSDSVNAIDWELKDDNMDMFNFYKGLIEWRHANSKFFYETAEDVLANTEILYSKNNVIGYRFNNGDDSAIVYTNANATDVEVKFPSGQWIVNVTDGKAGTTELSKVGGTIKLAANSYIVATGPAGMSAGAIIAISIGAAVVLGGATVGILIAKGKIKLGKKAIDKE